MTINDTPSYIRYTWDGAKGYTFPFRILANTDILITFIDDADASETELTLTTDYTVTFTADVDGGTATVTWTTTDTGVLVIERNLAYTQGTDWVNASNFDLEQLEDDLDRQAMLMQQLRDKINNLSTFGHPRGAWATTNVYYDSEWVTGPDENLYVCLEDHTAGTFATDLAASKWQLILDVSSVSGMPTATEGQMAIKGAANWEAVDTGITDDDIVRIDGADVADDEYARFTANGLESRTKDEVRGDLLDGTTITNVDPAVDDEIFIQDTSDSGNHKTITTQDLLDLPTSHDHKSSAYESAGMTIPNNTATTVVFDTEIYDPGSHFSTVEGVHEAAVTGKYLIIGQVFIDDLDDGDRIEAYACLDGTTKRRMRSYACGAGQVPGVTVICVLSVTAAQEISIKVLHTEGADQAVEPGTTYTTMTVHLLSL